METKLDLSFVFWHCWPAYDHSQRTNVILGIVNITTLMDDKEVANWVRKSFLDSRIFGHEVWPRLFLGTKWVSTHTTKRKNASLVLYLHDSGPACNASKFVFFIALKHLLFFQVIFWTQCSPTEFIWFLSAFADVLDDWSSIVAQMSWKSWNVSNKTY